MITADSVVIDIIARLDKAEGDIKRMDATFAQSSKSMKQSARVIEDALDRVGQQSTSTFSKVGSDIDRTTAHTANATRNLGRQVADVGTQLAGGQSPFLIFAQQAPQVADALADTGGAAAKVASFFAGPWGAGILAAGSVLGVLIGQLLSTTASTEALSKAAQEDAEQSERTRVAKENFTISLEGQEIATRQLNAEMAKEVQTSREVEAQAYREAQAHLTAELAERKRLQGLQQLRRDELQATRDRAQAAGANSDARALSIAPAQSALDQIDVQIAANNKAISEAEQRVGRTQFKAMAGEAERAADPIARINELYDRRAEAVLNAALANDNFSKSLERMTAAERAQALAAQRAKIKPQLNKIETDRASALSNARTKPAPEAQIGRVIGEAQARSIVESIGGRVTSGRRSTERQAELYADYKAGRGNLAAPPGSSLHEQGLAVDVAKSAGVTLAKLKAAFEKQGVRVTELLDEGDHFHVGYGRKGSAGRDAAAAKRAADEAVRNQRAFEDERNQLNQELLRALGSQTQDATTLAQLAVDQIEAETRAKLARIDAEEKLGQRTKAEAAELRAIVENTEQAHKANVAAALQERIAHERLAKAQAEIRNQDDLLSAQLGLADTQKQRHDIESQLLDLKYRELRLQEEANLAAALRNKDAGGKSRSRPAGCVAPA